MRAVLPALMVSVLASAALAASPYVPAPAPAPPLASMNAQRLIKSSFRDAGGAATIAACSLGPSYTSGMMS